jgi:hypothetical protein
MVLSRDDVSVIIVNKSIRDLGVIANAAFVIGLTAGRLLPDETFGSDVTDGSGSRHLHLTRIGHVVRKAGAQKLRRVRDELAAADRVTVVGYPEQAAPADYALYAEALEHAPADEINYRAIHAWGPRAVIEPVTSNLSRL